MGAMHDPLKWGELGQRSMIGSLNLKAETDPRGSGKSISRFLLDANDFVASRDEPATLCSTGLISRQADCT